MLFIYVNFVLFIWNMNKKKYDNKKKEKKKEDGRRQTDRRGKRESEDNIKK